MAKTKGVMVPHYASLVEPEDFLALIFWDKKELIYDAKRMLEMVARGEISRENWKEAIEKLGITQNRYYRILRRLRKFGLVEKGEWGEYKISGRFSSNLRRIAEYWDGYSEKLRRKSE